MNRANQEKWLQRLDRFPLLRMLFLEAWFRLAFALFVLLLVFLALFLPKIWKISPPGFTPVIKVSGLDRVQAWSLQRAGRKHQAAGKHEEAAFAWRAAIFNYPTDPALYRGALRNHLQNPRPPAAVLNEAVQFSLWLFRLAGTNVTDAGLAAQVYEKFRLYDLTLRFLGPIEDRLENEQKALLLKALFHSGMMEDFTGRWDKTAPKLKNDPELSLYHAAYLAGWGPTEKAIEAKAALAKAGTDPARRVLAHRLQLAVGEHQKNAETYQRSLKLLEQWGEDTLAEQADYWRLLVESGRKAEAQELARTYTRPPASALDTMRLAAVYLGLGLQEQALQFLKREAPRFGYAAELWMLYANALIDAKQWDELRALAIQIRQRGEAMALTGYSYYLEGRADFAQDRKTSAEQAFQKLRQHPFDHSSVVMSAASGLMQMDQAELARDLLLKPGRQQEVNAAYWGLLFSAAFKLKQPEVMLSAAAKAYERQPANLVFANNYAAALLTLRQQPEKAIEITLKLLTAFPDSLVARINHSFALVLNGRARDAEQLLVTIDPKSLTHVEASSFLLCRFEVCHRLKQYDRAWEASDGIDRATLFPSQAQWLEEAQKQMPARGLPKI